MGSRLPMGNKALMGSRLHMGSSLKEHLDSLQDRMVRHQEVMGGEMKVKICVHHVHVCEESCLGGRYLNN